jgi:hypothetical protein
MAILLNAKYFQSPTGGAVAPLERHPKLINVDELQSADLEDPKRRGAVPVGEHPKLDLCTQSLKGLNRGLLLGDLDSRLSSRLEMHCFKYSAPPLL